MSASTASPGNLSGLSGHPASASSPAYAVPAAPRYSWSTDQEQFYGDCASREEAIAEALDEDPEDAEGDPRTRVWTGLCVPVVPTAGFDAATVIDDIRGAVFDDVSDEVVPDDWPAVDRAAELELEEALEAVVVDWVARHAPPTFWSVEQVREHQVEPPPSGGEPVPDEPPQVIVDPTRCTECGDGHCSGCDWEQPGPAPAAVDATGHERTCLAVVHQVSDRDAQELSLCTCGAARAGRAA